MFCTIMKMKDKRFIEHMPVSEVFKIADQIDYDEHMVSSITLVKKSDLIVTLFSLYEGEEIGGHSSTGDAMVQVLDGVADIKIGDTVHRLKEGETIIMPANINHALMAVKSFKMLLTVVK